MATLAHSIRRPKTHLQAAVAYRPFTKAPSYSPRGATTRVPPLRPILPPAAANPGSSPPGDVVVFPPAGPRLGTQVAGSSR